jgi:hypothetical protein
MALAEQRSLVEFPSKIKGKLLQQPVGVTIRHNCGVKNWTAALRSWIKIAARTRIT